MSRDRMLLQKADGEHIWVRVSLISAVWAEWWRPQIPMCLARSDGVYTGRYSVIEVGGVQHWVRESPLDTMWRLGWALLTEGQTLEDAERERYGDFTFGNA